MQHLLKFLIALFVILYVAALPIPSDPPLGTIHGLPVVAIVHGNSDILKDEVRTKDSEDDPLEAFGKIIE